MSEESNPQRDAAQSEDAAPPKSRRGGARRKPISCEPCRRHKLRCDRKVPCATCTRYRREDDCRLNPAPPVRKSAVHLCTADASTHLRDSVFEGSNTAGAIDERRGPFGPARGPPQSTDSGDFPQRLKSLLTFGSAKSPTLALPQLLAEACRRGPDRALWRGVLDAQDRSRVWRQQLASVLPTRSQCDLLANFYLEHVNWLFQTIHVTSFRKEYSKFWEDGIGTADLAWTSLLFAIISLSALYIPLETVPVVGIPSESIRQLAHVWHQASQQALKAGECEAKPSMSQLQGFSVTQLYWYATNRIETLNSRMGQAIRQAQALGLDRDTSESRHLEDEMRHRIWWDLVDSDMFQSVCLDRAPLIRLQSPGVPLPLNCNDDDIDDYSIRPRPKTEPTVMSMNIFRAQLFVILNQQFHASSPFSNERSYEQTCQTDLKILKLMEELPWYFQIENGNPPQLPEALSEILTWQHHILRTCISTQRIRMLRPFLSERVGTSLDCCVMACADAMAIYRTLRQNVSQTSRNKFLPQAYQVFSVAVTVATLFLIEGQLPIPDALEQAREMAQDLHILEAQGCPVPIATNGRRILFRLLELCDSRAGGSASPDDARRLVPDIAIILGGETSTSAYMNRLSNTSDSAITVTPPVTHANELSGIGDRSIVQASTREDIDVVDFVPSSDAPWDEDDEGYLQWAGEGISQLELFNWDMSGMLPHMQR